MKKNKVFWIDKDHNKLTKEQVNDDYLKNIIKFVCEGGGYFEEMSEDMIKELFREAKRRKLDIGDCTLEQALDEYKSGTTTEYKLFTPNYDFPDYGYKLNPVMDARNIEKNTEKSLRIAVVGLTRDELKKEFNAKQLNNRDTFTDGVNTYFYVNDELPNTHGRMFDKVYDLRLLKSEITFDLMSRLSNYPDGYYIGREMYGLVFVQKVLERLEQQDKEIESKEKQINTYCREIMYLDNKIKQLKQSQKQLAISELENTLNNLYFDVARQGLCLSDQDKQFIDLINNRIKELRGGENDLERKTC